MAAELLSSVEPPSDGPMVKRHERMGFATGEMLHVMKRTLELKVQSILYLLSQSCALWMIPNEYDNVRIDRHRMNVIAVQKQYPLMPI